MVDRKSNTENISACFQTVIVFYIIHREYHSVLYRVAVYIEELYKVESGRQFSALPMIVLKLLKELIKII